MKSTFQLSAFSFLLSAFSFLSFSFLSLAQSTDFSGRLSVSPDWAHSKTTGVSTVQERFSRILDQTHTYGTNAGQMTAVVQIAGSLTNGQTTAVALTAGVADSFGDTIVFTRLSVLACRASASNLGAIHLGTASTNWLSSTNSLAIIQPGGLILLAAPDATGYPAAALSISNASTNPAAYTLTVAGS
jgi:hypothetical protein